MVDPGQSPLQVSTQPLSTITGDSPQAIQIQTGLLGSLEQARPRSFTLLTSG
jgi:hypothetical protein